MVRGRSLSDTRRTGRRLLCILFLLILTFYLVLVSYFSPEINLCDERRKAVTALRGALDDLSHFRRLDRVADESAEKQIENATEILRKAKNAYRRMERLGWRLRTVQEVITKRDIGCGRCNWIDVLQAAEWPLFARNGVAGFMGAFLAVVGMRSGTVVELDAAGSEGVMLGAATLVALGGWEGVIVCERWSGYNRVHQILEGERVMSLNKEEGRDGMATVVERRGKGLIWDVEDELRAVGYLGEFDLMMLWLDGEDYRVWERLGENVKPRFVAVRFQEYWAWNVAVVRRFDKNQTLGRESNVDVEIGRKPLFVGASLLAYVRMAEKKGYKLVHCLEASPIAMFARELELDNLLHPVEAKTCFALRKRSKVWRLDMQAQWNDAQFYSWKDVDT